MTIKERDQLLITPLTGYDPPIGRWLWLLDDSRRRTVEVLAGMAESALDWRPDEEANTIGTLLYHIVAIELDWLYVEILEQPDYGAKVSTLFCKARSVILFGIMSSARAGIMPMMRPRRPLPRKSKSRVSMQRPGKWLGSFRQSMRLGSMSS